MQVFKYIFVLTLMVSLVACNRHKLIQPTQPCTLSSEFPLNTQHPKAPKIQALMNEYAAKGIPGMSVLIHDKDGFWYGSKGYADLEGGVMMQPCNINKLGSITKMMMATVAWQLVQQGKLDLEKPISTYIPEVASKITNGKDIKVSMLIDHTSGIYDIGGDLGYNLAVVNDFTKSWTSDEILAYIANKPATNLPGATVNYSNSNTMLEGMIIEKVSGRKHGELLKELILQPLGMNSTYYYNYAQPFPTNILAQGYLDFNNDGGDIQNISNLNPGSGNAYTGVYSTVGDLYKFMNALLVEKKLTTPDNLNFIFSNMRSNDENTYQTSMGGIHREFKEHLPDSIIAYGHGGGDIGYSANLDYLPHNNTIFAATFNYGSNLPSPLREELTKLRNALIKVMAE